MLNKLDNDWRSRLIFIFFVAMLLSLCISRAALSVSMGMFVLVSILHTGIKKQVAAYLSSPLLWGMGLLFLVPLLSGMWSEDKTSWMEAVRIKLPLLLLPLAFAGPFSFSEKQWAWLAYIFIALLLVATGWSMIKYLADMKAVHAAYLQAKTIITPLGNDHVRFSWLVSVAALLSAWMGITKRKEKGWPVILLYIAAAWFIIYLHILAARTGLLSLYAGLLLAALWLVIKKMKWQYGIALLAVVVLLPVLAWFTLPTFQNRVRYIQYDLQQVKEKSYLPGANDGMRIISLQGGWQVLQEAPWRGAGFGDIKQRMDNWYAANFPTMQEADKIYPSGEWLMYGAGAGWPGMLVFIAVMLIPFFIRVKNILPWWILNSTAALSLVFDIGLEVQYGVFVYSFIILWWWKWWKS